MVLLYRHTMRGSLQAAIELIHKWSLDLLLIVLPLWCLCMFMFCLRLFYFSFIFSFPDVTIYTVVSWLFNGLMLLVERNQKEKDAIAKGQTSMNSFAQ
jgi:hypothetical protein